MKNLFLLLSIFMFSAGVFAQNTNTIVSDQNPNYMESQKKYTDLSNEYSLLQSTTAQETYKAIDPLEEKRELKSLRRQYRAQRPYWRHQRRLERIRNTQYLQYDNGYGYNNFGNNYNYGFRNRFNRFGFRGHDLLGLGLLGACILN